jgi:putative DNA primase/helicase
MPDGSPGPGIANSMVLFAEDGMADTVRPRLTRLGADHDRVLLPNLDDDDEGLWTFPKDLARLDQSIRDCEIRLLVIDPIMAFLDASINSGNDQSLRRLLTPLKALAEKLRCAILFLRHF